MRVGVDHLKEGSSVRYYLIFIKPFKYRMGEKYYKHLGTLVRYCDDFVVIYRAKKDINHVYKVRSDIMKKLEIQLYLEKTRFVNLRDGKEGFDFLGFHHRSKSVENGKGQKYSTTVQEPSQKTMKAMREKIKRSDTQLFIYT